MYFAMYENKSYVDDDDLVESLDSSLTFSETGVALIMPKSLSSRGVTSRCVEDKNVTKNQYENFVKQNIKMLVRDKALAK